jgi:hypothetical protein
MNTYEIYLPTLTNDRARSYEAARIKWQALALDLAGGYTRYPFVDGAWRGAGGRTELDQMVPYRVACSSVIWADLLAQAFALFPDQAAIMFTKLGKAEIVNRLPAPL